MPTISCCCAAHTSSSWMLTRRTPTPSNALHDIKAAHEDRIRIVTDITADRASHVLRYGAKIGEHDSPVSFSRVRLGTIPDRYPAEGRSIGIEIRGNAANDGEAVFWVSEPLNLRRQFATHVRARIAAGEVHHLSVFALGPIPLLIELGRLLGDITPADVFQLHREPAGWREISTTYLCPSTSVHTGPTHVREPPARSRVRIGSCRRRGGGPAAGARWRPTRAAAATAGLLPERLREAPDGRARRHPPPGHYEPGAPIGRLGTPKAAPQGAAPQRVPKSGGRGGWKRPVR